MSDISQLEMGLIIGLVLGGLLLTLIAVLLYIMYDKKHAKKDNSARSAAGSSPRMPRSASNTPGVTIVAATGYLAGPPAAGQNWTTINNSMVGLEMCDTSNSQLAEGELHSTQQSANGSARQASCSAVTMKTFFAELLAAFTAMVWPSAACRRRLLAFTRSPRRSRGQGGCPAPPAVGTAASAKEPHAGLAPWSQSSGKLALISEPFMTVLPGADSGLAVVMVHLDGGSKVPEDSDALPLGGCVGDAIVSLTLAPPVASTATASAAPAPAACTTTVVGRGACGPKERAQAGAPAAAAGLPSPGSLPPLQLHGGVQEGLVSSRVNCLGSDDITDRIGRRSIDNGSCVVELGISRSLSSGARKAACAGRVAGLASAMVKPAPCNEGLGLESASIPTMRSI